ncbi:PaaI family thioesterase [Nonomuraea cavernae]|nr:PaaI family thioesterase [Nonomuraea cavernae]MCA2187433.1 PaaI family thioesterase [Nonomuraea cavernae]
MDVDAGRRGVFWEVRAGRVPPPPAAVLLGWELVEVDPELGTIEVAFKASEQFTNPVGVIQGGFLAAMLDDTLGPALVATLPENQFAPTLDLHVQFLRPARPGRLLGRGRIVQRQFLRPARPGRLLGRGRIVQRGKEGVLSRR